MTPTQLEMQESEYRDQRIPWPVTWYGEVFVQICTFLPEVMPRYWVSNFGRIYDSMYGFCLVPIVKPTGYCGVNLAIHRNMNEKGNSSRIYPIQRLVCMAFHGMPLDPKMQANHIDCRTWNNDAANLEWLTPKQNVQYSYQCGNRGYGEAANNSVFTNEQVTHLCELLSQGMTDIHEMSRCVFGCELTPQIKTLIYNVRSRTLWTFISKNYQFDPPPAQRVFSDDDVRRVCEYADAHMHYIGIRGFVKQLARDVFGIDVSNAEDNSPEHRLSAFIQTILRGEKHRNISSQYHFLEGSTTISRESSAQALLGTAGPVHPVSPFKAKCHTQQ